MSKILRVIFFFSVLLVNIYANNIPQLQTKNQGSVLHVRYFDEGKKFLTTYYTSIEVYDSQSLKQLYSIPHDGSWNDQKTIEVSNAYQQLFVITDRIFSVYSLNTGALVFRKNLDDYFHIEQMIFSPNEDRLTIKGERRNGWFADSYDLVRHEYTVSTDQIDTIIRSHKDYSCYSQDKRYQFQNNELLQDGKLINRIDFKFYDRNSLRCAFSPDNTQLVLAGRQFVVYDINESRTRMPQILAQEPIQKIGLSRDKMLLQGDNLYIGWDLKEGKELWRNISQRTMCHDCSPNPVHVLLNHQDRALIKPSYAGGFGVFVGGTDGLIDMDMNTGRSKPLEVNRVGSLQLCDDDKRFAVGSGDGTVSVYDTKTLNMISSFKGDQGQAYVGGFDSPSMLMSKDGKKIMHRYEGHYYGAIRILDIDQNATMQISLPGGYSSNVYGRIVDLSHDGKLALTSYPYMDTTHIYVVNLENQKAISEYSFKGFEHYATYFFENDHDYIVLQSNGKIKRIDIATGAIKKEANFEGAKNIYRVDNSRYLFVYADGKQQIVDKESFEIICNFQAISFENGEWVLLTEDGYFNASSKRILENLIIEDSAIKRAMSDEEVKKYYRPDIVSAILQQKSIYDLEAEKLEFTLREKAKYVNQYYPSLRAMYEKDRDPYGLVILAQEKNPNDLKLIKEAILESNSLDIKSTLYRSLENFDENETLSFVYEQLDKPSSIDDQVVLLSLIKNIDKRVQKISELLSKKLLSEKTKIWFATWARAEDCQTFEPLLWQAVEKSLRIRNEVVLNYLIQQNPKRLEKIWMESAIKVLKENNWSSILDLTRILPYLYRLNPTQTIKLLIDPQYPFNVNLYESVRDPAFVKVLLDHLIVSRGLDYRVFKILRKYQNQEINNKIIAKINETKCKNIAKSLIQELEKDLNTTLMCE